MSSVLKPLLLQSFRTGGLYLLIIALSLAISATTALKFSNTQVQNAVSLQAAEMLGADLVLSDNDPIQSNWVQKAQQLHLKQTPVTLFGSILSMILIRNWASQVFHRPLLFIKQILRKRMPFRLGVVLIIVC